MRLLVRTPTGTEVDAEVTKVSVQAVGGAFTLLPRHIDVAAILETGLLTFEEAAGGEPGAKDEIGEEIRDGAGEGVVAVDGGTVVKVGSQVLVSTPTAVRAADLDSVRRAVDEMLLARRAHRRSAGRALARLEVDVMQRMVELEEEVVR